MPSNLSNYVVKLFELFFLRKIFGVLFDLHYLCKQSLGDGLCGGTSVTFEGKTK